jgi:ubiquinone/menaquinone biosynthesis C-methylase UbiE
MSEDMTGAFKATYAELYDRHLVPMLFAPYAPILAERAKMLGPRNILEIAAGTGIATRELAQTLPAGVPITATDLNQPMIDRARVRPGVANITWQQADAMKLPFPDASFDLIVCQFGVMFFPDKQASFREASRVLRQGGTYRFAVWDAWKKMPSAPLTIAADVVGDMLGLDPSSLVNPPYHCEETIRADLGAANFRRIDIQRITQPAMAASARDAPIAAVHGSLIRTAIVAVDPERLDEATDAVERALRAKLGKGPIDVVTNALIVAAEKPLA